MEFKYRKPAAGSGNMTTGVQFLQAANGSAPGLILAMASTSGFFTFSGGCPTLPGMFSTMLANRSFMPYRSAYNPRTHMLANRSRNTYTLYN
jgi:hypothetical protein